MDEDITKEEFVMNLVLMGFVNKYHPNAFHKGNLIVSPPRDERISKRIHIHKQNNGSQTYFHYHTALNKITEIINQ